MPQYRYSARTPDGQIVTGQMDAQSAMGVHASLRQQALVVLDVQQAQTSASRDLGKRSVPPQRMATFCQQFSSVLRAGIPFVRALDIVRQQTSHKRLRAALDSVYAEVQSGHSMSEAMAAMPETFPVLMIESVRAGEAGGSLDDVMDDLGVSFSKSYAIRQKLRNAAIYPTLVLVITFAVVYIVLTVAMPKFVAIFAASGAALPAPTQALLALSDFLARFGWLVALLIAGATLAYKSITARGPARLHKDQRKLQSRLFGKLRMYNVSARFCRTLSMLLAAGVPFTQSLTITADVLDNRYAQQNVLELESQVRRGHSLATLLSNQRFFPVLVANMAAVGEESGTIDDMLRKAADYFEQELDTSVTRISAIIEPIMILIVALIVVILVVAIVLPMFQMVNLTGVF